MPGCRVLDAGASTGGFTDCLLQRGAAEIVAVDVGYGQLHERVAGDPRVRVVDRTNVRDLDPAIVGEPVDLVTADLSFISLRLVLDALLGVLRPGGALVALVKPQFEAGRQVVARGRGIVTDPDVWRTVLDEVTSACEARGATIMGVMASPITGTDGNVEFLLHARRAGAGRDGRSPMPIATTRSSGPWPRRPALVGPAAGAMTVVRPGAAPGAPRGRSTWRSRPPVGSRRRATRCASRPSTPATPRWSTTGSPRTTFAAGLDVAVSLGGDGCMLRAVHLVAAEGVPVLGVNLGPARLPHRDRAGRACGTSLDRFLAGDFAIEERMLLQVTGRRCAGVGRHRRRRRCWRSTRPCSRRRRAATPCASTCSIDGATFTPYAADGLIVATATGSTAYNLSARGPIVAPTHRAMVLTPVSPHMLFDRSLVLEPDTVLRLTVSGHRPAGLAVDGRMVAELEPGRRHRVHGLAAPGPAGDVRTPRLPPHPQGQVRPERPVTRDR